MTQDDKKRAAAQAALAYVKPDDIVGVGTGSTVNYFIEALAAKKISSKVPSLVLMLPLNNLKLLVLKYLI